MTREPVYFPLVSSRKRIRIQLRALPPSNPVSSSSQTHACPYSSSESPSDIYQPISLQYGVPLKTHSSCYHQNSPSDTSSTGLIIVSPHPKTPKCTPPHDYPILYILGFPGPTLRPPLPDITPISQSFRSPLPNSPQLFFACLPEHPLGPLPPPRLSHLYPGAKRLGFPGPRTQ